MTIKIKAAGLWTQAAFKTTTRHENHSAAPAVAQFAKGAIVHLALWGLLPPSGSCWLIRQLGLRAV